MVPTDDNARRRRTDIGPPSPIPDLEELGFAARVSRIVTWVQENYQPVQAGSWGPMKIDLHDELFLFFAPSREREIHAAIQILEWRWSSSWTVHPRRYVALPPLSAPSPRPPMASAPAASGKPIGLVLILLLLAAFAAAATWALG